MKGSEKPKKPVKKKAQKTLKERRAAKPSHGSAFSLRASSGGFWRRGDAAEAQALLENPLPRAERYWTRRS
jgi:hypothetical protein